MIQVVALIGALLLVALNGFFVAAEFGLVKLRQTRVQSAEAEAFIEADTEKPALKDSWGFVATVLGWEARHVAGSPGGPPLPDALMVRLPEHDTTLAPTWAVRWRWAGSLSRPRRPAGIRTGRYRVPGRDGAGQHLLAAPGG